MTRLRVGPVVAVSLIAALASGVGLVLGPVAGAPEHVITGVTLISWAAGWGVVAILSTRWTDQPQRWAIAPAVFLGIVGAGLLLLAPTAAAIDALGWIWPPMLLAQVVCMTIGARRDLRSRTRRCLVYPAIGLFAMIAIGGAVETLCEYREGRASPSPGATVEVNGRRMHIACSGAGSPTAILESGLGETAAYWGWIAPRVARTTRVCAYDRAGRGASDEASSPRDGVGVATDLHALLASAQVAGPFVLVGHSSGAQYVRIFAGRYPEDVAGVVLLDPQPTEAFTRLPAFPRFYRVVRPVSALFPSLARFGVARLIAYAGADGLPAEARALRRISASTAGNARSFRDEFAELPVALDQANAVKSFGDKPLIVVTAVRDAQVGWLPLQNEIARLSTNSVHRVLQNVTHSSLIEGHRDALNASQAIRDVIEAVRRGGPLVRP